MKKMIVAVLVAFAAIPAEAQAPAAPTDPKVGLLLLPAPIKLKHHCFSQVPKNYPVPQGFGAWMFHRSEKCLIDMNIKTGIGGAITDLADLFFKCDEKWSHGKIRDGQKCVCKSWQSCGWEDIPPKPNPSTAEEKTAK